MKSLTIFFKRISLLFLVVGLTVSCSDSDQSATTNTILRIGILPDQGKEELQRRFKPLLAHIEIQTGLTTQLVLPASYKELLELFHQNKVDMAYFGGFTFLKANKQDGAKPLLMRDVDTHFTSLFIVRNKLSGMKLTDFKGKKFAFGSKLSTSGHLMPRYFMNREDINPEKYFKNVQYSGSHSKTALLVNEGKADIGVLNSKVVHRMLKNGAIDKNKVRILWETPPYPDYVWALHPKFDKNMEIKLRDSFLKLSKTKKEQAHILELLGAHYFLPASLDDFQRLKNIGKKLNLL